jgi:hypothetical protein
MIIPDQNFVWRILRISISTNKCQNVAPEQHLNDFESPTFEITSESFLKRLTIINAKAMACASSKAAIILVPGCRNQFHFIATIGFQLGLT